ncbi:hypothetical protein NDA01_26005 [Trichocoleus desertorum AS-A10]|uniref:hypothetical protein n=1 Tax=Trichocoleus desertorum TaxID=1481672 RepID=UPI0032994DB3
MRRRTANFSRGIDGTSIKAIASAQEAVMMTLQGMIRDDQHILKLHLFPNSRSGGQLQAEDHDL